MRKKIVHLLISIVTVALTAMSVYAANNYLNSVVLETTENGYNIVLRSDARTKIKKTVQANDRITLTLKGITASGNISTLYKNTPDVQSLVVENGNNNDLKIYVNAPNISKANVVFENPDSAPVAVDLNSAFTKLLCIAMFCAIIFIGIKSTRTLNAHEHEPYYKKDIKNRELEMYRNFKKEVAAMSKTKPSINYKLNNTRYSTNSVRNRERNTIRNIEQLTRLN